MSKFMPPENIKNINNVDDNDSEKQIKLKRKLKKKRKHSKKSDPSIVNISNLLSTNLQLISPEKNGTMIENLLPCSKKLGNCSSKWDETNMHSKSEVKASQILDNVKLHSETENLFNEQNVTNKDKYVDFNDQEGDNTPEFHDVDLIEETPTKLRKHSKNAFEFMMESRNKSIGRNSPGKEIENDVNIPAPEIKEKLGKRKLKLEKWALTKESKKRKIDEKEREIYIKQHLKKRAKRMKNMLSIKDSSDKQYKNVKKLISDSEDSQDIYVDDVKNTKQCTTRNTISINYNTQTDRRKSSDSVPCQKVLHTFLGIPSTAKQNNKKLIEDKICRSAENENPNSENVIRIKMFSPSVLKKKKKTNKDDINSDECLKCEEKQHKTRKAESRKPKKHTKINDAEIQKEPEFKKKITKSNISRTVKSVNAGDESSDAFECIVNDKPSRVSRSSRAITKCKDSIICSTESKTESFNNEESMKSHNKTRPIKLAPVFLHTKVKEQLPRLVSIDDDNSNDSNKNISLSKNSRFRKAPANSVLLIDNDLDYSDHNKKKRNRARKSDAAAKLALKQPKVKSKINPRKSLIIDDESSNDLVCEINSDSESDKIGSLRRSSRARRNTNKYTATIYVEYDSEDSDNNKNERKIRPKPNKATKLAPVFLQPKVKPKIDPLVLEARRNFLMSGIPDALKRTMEKQHNVDEIEPPNLFPEISHVQQKTIKENCIDYWNLPKPNISMMDTEIYIPDIALLKKGSLKGINDAKQPTSTCAPSSPEPIKNFKVILREIKKNNPDYPVFRSFRSLKMEADSLVRKKKPMRNKESKKKKTSRQSKKDVHVQQTTESHSTYCGDSFLMWTEKYSTKRLCWDLKRWLQEWQGISESGSKKPRRRNSSESDFESVGVSSEGTIYDSDNTIILHGPHGSGKTSTVYEMCNELGFDVLELNASSKRTGKRLTQELQEATQSHQVRESETCDINAFLISANDKKRKITSQTKDPQAKKICLLLVEDVDVVFEQDEGFLAALLQLISTSKRPIVLTATDIAQPSIEKILSLCQAIEFSSVPDTSAAIWLQIVCLVEGCYVNKDSLTELLEWNKWDMRKTLLQLQFWVQSGGGNAINTILETNRDLSIDVKDSNDDEPLNEEINSSESANVSMHSKCLSNFLDETSITLDKLWWNLPNFSILPPITRRQSTANTEVNKITFKKTELETLSFCLDALSEIDKCFAMAGIVDRNLSGSDAKFELIDTIELGEVYDCFNDRIDFTKEWACSLFTGHMRACKTTDEVILDMGLPDPDERRYQTKQNTCARKYMDILPLSCWKDRKSFHLDYFPNLRNISRSETARLAGRSKRNRRYFSYFRYLVRYTFSDTVSETACSMFKS